MYNITQVKTNLAGVVGWKQPFDAEFAILNGSNLLSSSGLYFQEAHSLVTIENLRATLPESLSDADFNTTLFALQKSIIAKMLQSVFQKKKPQTKSLLEKIRLFDQANVMDDPITNAGLWVGYKIDLDKSNNIKVVIDAIGSEFDGIKSGLTIYLFHSSQKTAVTTFSLDTVAENSKWDDLTDFDLDYLTYIGGTYYIGYKQDDLGVVQALNRGWDLSDQPNKPKYFNIEPIRIENYTGIELFDIDDIELTSDSYGLNFKFTTTIDLTNIISDQKEVFANLINMQMAADVLEKISNSTRDNAIKKETRNLALYELKGSDMSRKTGLLYKLEKAIEETEFDFSALDDQTLPIRDKFPFTDF